MRFYQKLDGAVHCSAKEYDIAANTAIAEGQVVTLQFGLVVPMHPLDIGPILGISAETHSGQKDAFDPRADGTSVIVIDDPGIVMQCAAPKITVAEATKTAITPEFGQLACFWMFQMSGGYVKPLSRGGAMRRIVRQDGRTLVLEDSAAPPNAGDEYAVFPPVGFDRGILNGSGDALSLCSTADSPLRVIGRDERFNRINLMAKRHIFAQSC